MDDHDDLQSRLRRMGTRPIEPERQAADLSALAAVRSRSGRRWSAAPKLRVAAAFLAGLLLGGTGLAAADALPDPAQHVAHTVLAQVGVDVPNPPRYHGPECGDEVKRNHGGYVRDDKALAQTDCGKPVHPDAARDDADDGPGTGPQGNGATKDACHGKPPWAGHTSMTPAEVAAAKAERAATCGVDDADEADEADEVEEADDVEVRTQDEATTTTAAPTTSTTEPPTTTTTAPTTTTTAGSTTTTG